jgi:hypothetical protein
MNAPDNVPIACAINGNKKYLNSHLVAFIGFIPSPRGLTDNLLKFIPYLQPYRLNLLQE